MRGSPRSSPPRELRVRTRFAALKSNLAYVVLGMGKSGTTALYTAISREIENAADHFFEVHDGAAIRRSDPANALVAKLLLEKVRIGDVEWLHSTFDKRVFLVRDPRDLLVSRLLYKVRDMDLIFDETTFGTWLDALREKERNPGSMSVVELYELLESLSGEPSYHRVFGRVHRSALEKWELLAHWYHLARYEPFVDGETSALSEYLEMPVSPDVEVDEKWRRVTRSKGYGDWKRWFLESDLRFVRSQAGDFFARFGYDEDWDLDAEPVIERETCSAYVERIVELRRSGRG